MICILIFHSCFDLIDRVSIRNKQSTVIAFNDFQSHKLLFGSQYDSKLTIFTEQFKKCPKMSSAPPQTFTSFLDFGASNSSFHLGRVPPALKSHFNPWETCKYCELYNGGYNVVQTMSNIWGRNFLVDNRNYLTHILSMSFILIFDY